eukprot:2761524-Pyramimonas_sp.AAC.1
MPVAAWAGTVRPSSLGNARVEDRLAVVAAHPDDAWTGLANARPDDHGLHELLAYTRSLTAFSNCHDYTPLPRDWVTQPGAADLYLLPPSCSPCP